MNYLLIENLAVLVCATVGFAFGIRYLKTRKALYAGMIVQGMICVVLGRLYQCALLWTGGSLTDNFQVGSLGVMGAFAFFFFVELRADRLAGGRRRKGIQEV